MEKIIIAPITRYGKKADYRHFVAYIVRGDELELIAPFGGEESAKEVGMKYNKSGKDLPAYTFHIYYSNWQKRLTKALEFTLKAMGYYGEYAGYLVDGFMFSKSNILKIQIGD
jgi:hypothetical protein